MNKKKLPFIQLAVIFGSITLMVLLYSWASSPNTASNSSMMEQSMGNMMKMHLKNVTVADLVKPQNGQIEISQGGNSIAGHHNAQYGFLKTMHYLTTATIVILLPFIIAGTVFLGIIWLK
ncbi:hypothetical protein [Cellulosilyticum sp. I15G10I2]|uniref:hypothetical protein n=1 Tax=Cellulosilyticum sp. I15G10I2 TaxID=1892843 RepID=UPI00085CD635|nr:hypothetical protein [Cellulosilyticum sp. I15G10I2]